MLTIRISPLRDVGKVDCSAPDTKRIQEAVDACHAQGGGKVVLEAGIYVTGTIRLNSHVTLCLEKDALLLGSGEIEDYPDNEGCFVDAVGHRRGRALLCAVDAENIGLEGEGTIDGRGGEFPPEHPGHVIRPFLVRLVRCTKVRIRGLELRQSAAWCLHLQECQNVTVEEVGITNRCNGNNDGIDIDGCRQVHVRDCHLDTGDDAICLKTTGKQPCEEILVTGCQVTTGWAAFKIGTESAGDFRKIEVADCVFYDVKGCGIKVVPVDGGSVEELYLHDIQMKNCTGPVFFSQGERLREYFGEQKEKPGRISHVRLERIAACAVSAKGSFYQGKPWGNALGCVVFSGLEQLPMEDVAVKDCVFHMPGGMELSGSVQKDIAMREGGSMEEEISMEGKVVMEEIMSRQVPEMGDQYPEFHLFDPLPCWGLYLRHIRGIRWEGVQMTCREPDGRPMTAKEDVSDVCE